MTGKIKFTLAGGAWGPLECLALCAYRRYWLDQPLRIRNPDFDRASGYILSLKDAANRDHAAAVNYFSRALIAEVKGWQFLKAELLVVPSSRAKRVGPGLEALAKKLAQQDSRVQYRQNGLMRTMDIAKLSKGGPRSLLVHRDSLQYFPQKMGPRLTPSPLVIILDDVATTGNSLVACGDLVRMGYENCRPQVVGLALGRTTDG